VGNYLLLKMASEYLYKKPVLGDTTKREMYLSEQIILEEVGNMKYLTEKEVSEITRLALSTLRNHRHLRRGIPYCKIGASVRYNEEDVLAFMEVRKIRFDSDQPSPDRPRYFQGRGDQYYRLENDGSRTPIGKKEIIF